MTPSEESGCWLHHRHRKARRQRQGRRHRRGRRRRYVEGDIAGDDRCGRECLRLEHASGVVGEVHGVGKVLGAFARQIARVEHIVAMLLACLTAFLAAKTRLAAVE